LREINERSAHLPHDEIHRAGYENAMTGPRTVTEVVRALCVLALLFLNFAHQPAFAQQTGTDVLGVAASQSFCGAPLADDNGHAPCHACRIGSGADLPPVTGMPVPLCVVATPSYGVLATLPVASRLPGAQSARGPPAA